MDYGILILHISRLVMGGLSAFFAIYLWSQTRDAAWMLIIMGIILRYLEITFSTLSFFGIIEEGGIFKLEIPVVRIVLENLPYLFFILALILMIRRQRFR